MSDILHTEQHLATTDLNTIFTHFAPQDIEEFYRLYQLWSLQNKRAEIVAQMQELAQQIAENEALLKAISPSAIALAALSQFRASGVDDIDLLDAMLERGDEWLDRTLQLFERCERMDMLQGSATQWCIHALEGAYDWIESMGDINEPDASNEEIQLFLPAIPTNQPLAEVEPLPATTEADFLHKLMSEDETTEHTLELDSQYAEIAYAPCHTLPETTETDNISEQVNPLAQPISSPTQPADTEQELASQTRKRKKPYRAKQIKKRTKQKFKRYQRKHVKDKR